MRLRRRRTIRLADDATIAARDAFAHIEDARYERCVLVGPAVCLLDGCRVDGLEVRAPFEAVWRFVGDDEVVPVGVIHMKDVEIVDCEIRAVSFIVKESQIGEVAEAIRPDA